MEKKPLVSFDSNRILIFLRLVAAIIMSWGMTLSFPADKQQIKLKGIKGFVKLLNSSSVRNHGFLAVYALGALLLLYYCGRLEKKAVGIRIMDALLAMVFALAQILGEAYDKYASWYPLTHTGLFRIRFLLAFAGISLFAYHALMALQDFLDKKFYTAAAEEGALSVRASVKTAVLLFVCWLPYYIFFYPGTNNADASYQIMQFFHRDTWSRYFTTVRADDIFLSNHFPVFTTYIYGFFAKIGLLLGDVRIGYGLYGLLQMILVAAVLAWMLRLLWEKGLRGGKYKHAVAYYALLPEFPFYAGCMLKDVLYTLCLIVLLMILWMIVESGGESLKRKGWNIGLFLGALLLILIRNNGVYFVALILPLCLICIPRYWKQILIDLLVPILFYHFVWMGVLMPALKVAPGGRQEGIGFAFQMTARYVKEHEEDVTEEEKEIIAKVIPYDELKQLYSPEITDPVKYRFYQTATDDEVKDYIKVWVKMFFKHPTSYVQSSLNIAYKMFDLGRFIRPGYYYWWNMMDETDELYTTNVFVNDNTVKKLKNIDRAIWHIPLVGLLINVAAYFWLSIFVAAELLRKKKWSFLIIMMPVLLTEVMMFVAPTVSGRYMMPLVFMSVPLIGLMYHCGSMPLPKRGESHE